MAFPGSRPVSGVGRVGSMRALPASYRGPGLRVRLARIRGVTAKGVLESPLILPALLGEFSVDEDFGWNSYSTVASGDYSTPMPGDATARKLRTSDMDTLTIDWHAYARWLTNPHVSPTTAKRELYKIGRAKTPFELLATLDFVEDELRMKAKVMAIRRSLKPGEADTRYYTLSLEEWRDNSLGRRSGGGGAHELPTTHALTAEDSLYSLAKKFYGAATEWRHIALENGIHDWGAKTALVKSSRFKVGSKVKIPAKIPKGGLFAGVGYADRASYGR